MDNDLRFDMECDYSKEDDVENIDRSLLETSGTIFLNGKIDSKASLDIIQKMLWVDSRFSDCNPINLIINSEGGAYLDAVAIIDVMNTIRIPVYTYCVGQAMSGAALILMSGKKEHRYCFPRARIMIHSISWWLSHNYYDFKVAAEEYTVMHKQLIDIVHYAAGRSRKQIEKDLERDKYFSSDQAVNYGICDKVLEGDYFNELTINREERLLG